MSYVLGTYARSIKENFVKGEGCYLYTDKGEKYLDFVQGIAVNAFGHNNEYLVKTMKSQADKPWHVSNLFLIQEQEKFAKRLCEFTKFDFNYFLLLFNHIGFIFHSCFLTHFIKVFS